MLKQRDMRLLLLGVESTLAGELDQSTRAVFAKAAREGIAALHDFEAEVAVIDFAMARMQARAFLRELRDPSQTPRPNLPVIGLLHQSTPKDVQRLIQAGIDHLLVKPTGQHSILQLAEHILRQRPASISTGSYIGPDRRRVDFGAYVGDDRRSRARSNMRTAELAR